METRNGYTPETTLRDYIKVLFRHKAVIITTFITVMATVIVGLKFKTPVYEAQVKVLISAEKDVEAPYHRPLGGFRDGVVARTQAEMVKSNAVIERVVQATGLYKRPLDYEKQFASPLKHWLIERQAKQLDERLSTLTEEQKNMYLFRLTVEDLKKSITVEPIRDTNLFTIKAREFNPFGAAVLANVVSRSYIIFDLEQQLAELQLRYGEKHLAVQQLKDNIEKMTEGLSGKPLATVDAIGPASVKIVEQAQVPLKPIGPPEILTVILALLMAPFLGVMLAFVFEYTDQTFKSPQDIQTGLNLPFLGSIPKKKRPRKEFLHKLSDQLYLLMKERNLRSILLTSALRREGVTTISANLARYLSQEMGHRVLIIDANLRNPAIHKAFKIPDSPGLTDVLEGKVSLAQAVKTIDSKSHELRAMSHEQEQNKRNAIGRDSAFTKSQEPRAKNEVLDILPAGKTKNNPTTILDSPKIIDVLNEAKEKYDIIIMDSANLKNFKDAVILSSSLDSAAIVVSEGRARRQAVKNAIESLEQKNGKVIGTILNKRHFEIPNIIYNRV